jgi:DNA repair exonuclease SbcCD ATPase subunit
MTQKLLDTSRSAKDKCHVCGSKIDAKILKKYQGDLVFQIEREKKALAIYTSDSSKLSKRIEPIRDQERVLVREIKELHDSGFHLSASLERLRSQVNQQDRLTKQIQDYQARIKVLEKNKQIHEQAQQFTLEEKQFVDICVNAVSRNGLPAYLCENAVPQLNQTAQHYSEVFADDEIGIQFAAANGDVDVNICNLHGGKLTKDQSAGEMRMAAIITAFTFRDCLLPLNLLIVDEPSEGLDPANSLAFAKGLNQVLDRFGHIMVISHNSNLLSALEPDRRIEIIKQNGVSRASIVIA